MPSYNLITKPVKKPVADEGLGDLAGHATVLVITEAKSVLENSIRIIKKLLETHDSGLCITVNQPYSTMKRILEKEGVKDGKIFFIDCISMAAGGLPQKTEDCLYVTSPAALTEIGISMTHALEALKGKNKFVFIDSLGTFLIYNSAGTMSKFNHFMVTKISLMGINGVFMLVEREMDEKLLSELQSFCEKTVKL